MNLPRRRIGFVDLNPDNFHANVYLDLVRGDLRGRGFDVAGVSATDTAAARAWSRAKSVPFFDDPSQLDRHVDCYMILAPSNPEAHLALCETFFPFGKPTYVDKTFAPDLSTARRIFALADTHHVPMQTSSALRYTRVQGHVGDVGKANVRHMITWGAGRSFDEYAIHPLELLVSCMGPRATRLMRRGTGSESQLLIDFTDGRTGVANVYTNADTPFAATVTTRTSTRHVEVDGTQIFRDLCAAQLDFFESAQPSIDREESLTIRALLDAANDPRCLEMFVTL